MVERVRYNRVAFHNPAVHIARAEESISLLDSLGEKVPCSDACSFCCLGHPECSRVYDRAQVLDVVTDEGEIPMLKCKADLLQECENVVEVVYVVHIFFG